jgi:hypothetical protein
MANLFESLENGADDVTGGSTPILSKKNIHEQLRLRTTKIRYFASTNPERALKVKGETFPGMNFIIEAEVVSGTTDQPGVFPGSTVSFLWKLDPTNSETRMKMDLAEIADALVGACGLPSFGDAKQLLADTDAAFEDETAYAGNEFVVFSKPAKTDKKTGQPSAFRNFGYAPAQPTAQTDAAPARRAVEVVSEITVQVEPERNAPVKVSRPGRRGAISEEAVAGAE